MINKIYQALESYQQQSDFIDLIDSNFLANGFQYPAELLQAQCRDYFSNHHYSPDSKGLLTARQSISNYYQAHGVSVGPEEIIITASTSESYSQLFTTLTRPGDAILLPNPVYPLFEQLADFHALKVQHYLLDPDNDWKVDMRSLEAAITPATRCIVLISPNNPTGSVIDAGSLQQILTIAEKHKLPLICDEVFSEFFFRNGDLPRITIKTSVPVFLLNGISKMFALPDLKLAWIAATNLAASSPVIDTLETINDTFLSANYLSQFLLPTLFEQGQQFQAGMVAAVQAQRDLLKNILADKKLVQCSIPAGGIHAVLTFPTVTMSEEEFVLDLLKESHLFVHPGYFYDYVTRQGASLVISFLKQKEQLEDGLHRLLLFAEKL